MRPGDALATMLGRDHEADDRPDGLMVDGLHHGRAQSCGVFLAWPERHSANGNFAAVANEAWWLRVERGFELRAVALGMRCSRRQDPARAASAVVQRTRPHWLPRQGSRWLGVARAREEYAKLLRSPVMKPSTITRLVDHLLRGPVRASWPRRRPALLKAMLTQETGATLLEAYPVDRRGRSNDDSMWFGAKSMYDDAGFREVARRKPRRPIVRLKPA